VIEHIDIRDLGVIAHASLPFAPGFTVVTGETGAGKTMVVTALGLLLGQRADTARVRQGADVSWVEGRFQDPGIPDVSDRVAELGGVIDDGELVVSRQVAGEGKSRAVVGGRSAPVSVLSELAEHLVVVHGQSDQIRLKSESAQREALDRFAGSSVSKPLAQYQEVFSRHQKNVAILTEMDGNDAAKRAEAERLQLAVSAIEAVSPEPGEDEKLLAISQRLENVEDLRQAAGSARDALSNDTGADGTDARALIDHAIRSLERVEARDQALAPIISSLRDGLFQVDDSVQALSAYLSEMVEGEGMDLEAVMARRSEITGLMRSYGPTLEDVLNFVSTASDRLLELDVSGDAKAALSAQVAADQAVLDELAREITAARTSAGEELSRRVSAELAALAMADAHFVVDISAKELTQFGSDQVSFLLAPHRGAPPRPVAKGASGGELSRVMLALEVVIAEADPVPTFIFDEVDAGIGGSTALEIGNRLATLAKTSQVICVTHLAQVAAAANHHLLVTKDQSGEVTESSVTVLTGDARVSELARMLGGDEASESAKAHAQEMLDRHSVSRVSQR